MRRNYDFSHSAKNPYAPWESQTSSPNIRLAVKLFTDAGEDLGAVYLSPDGRSGYVGKDVVEFHGSSDLLRFISSSFAPGY